MAFLKKFFEPSIEPTLQVISETSPIPILTPIPCPQAEPLVKAEQYQPAIIEPVKFESDPRIKAIEGKALALGWTWQQLWQKSKRYDLKGLADLIRPDQTITTITPEYIQLERISSMGIKEASRFYNMYVDQPWLAHN